MTGAMLPFGNAFRIRPSLSELHAGIELDPKLVQRLPVHVGNDCTAHIRGQPAVSIKSARTWIFTALLRESANRIVCSVTSSKGWRAATSSLLPYPAGKTAANFGKLPVALRIDSSLAPALKHA